MDCSRFQIFDTELARIIFEGNPGLKTQLQKSTVAMRLTDIHNKHCVNFQKLVKAALTNANKVAASRHS